MRDGAIVIAWVAVAESVPYSIGMNAVLSGTVRTDNGRDTPARNGEPVAAADAGFMP